MIRSIHIENFKSINHIDIEFDKFNCFVGVNGAGKTSILQALDFICQLMHGNMKQWLEARGWTNKEIGYRGVHGEKQTLNSNYIFVIIFFGLKNGDHLCWSCGYSKNKYRTISESVTIFNDTSEKKIFKSEHIFSLEDFSENLLMKLINNNTYEIENKKNQISFDYEGSIFSQLKSELLPQPILEFRDFLRNIKSLESLSPHLLKKRSRAHQKNIGIGGERLSGYLSTLKGQDKDEILSTLKHFYPSISGFRISTAKGGWKRLLVSESIENKSDESQSAIETEAVHINDGFLRIIAIIAQLGAKETGMVLLDEIENGINPEIIEQLVTALVNANSQIRNYHAQPIDFKLYE